MYNTGIPRFSHSTFQKIIFVSSFWQNKSFLAKSERNTETRVNGLHNTGKAAWGTNRFLSWRINSSFSIGNDKYWLTTQTNWNTFITRQAILDQLTCMLFPLEKGTEDTYRFEMQISPDHKIMNSSTHEQGVKTKIPANIICTCAYRLSRCWYIFPCEVPFHWSRSVVVAVLFP